MKIEYFACINNKMFPGVEKKLMQTINSFYNIGFDAKLTRIDGNKYNKYIKLANSVAKSDADIIIIRNLIGLLFCLPSLILLRLKRKFIIIDVPTPIKTTIYEFTNDNYRIANILNLVIYYIFFPIALYPANRVLHYSHDSKWFTFGIKNKVKLISNGINTEEIAYRHAHPPLDDYFNIIAIGSLGYWHGFDRIIKSINKYNISGKNIFKINFTIVGDGSIKKEWEDLTKSLNLQEYVRFTGYLSGNELDKIFENAHIAISSIGLYRKNLLLASDLKSREYCARGIPFISAGDDIDFTPTPAFMMKLINSEIDVDMDSIINWYKNYIHDNPNPQNIREYAEERLDFKSKLYSIIGP